MSDFSPKPPILEKTGLRYVIAIAASALALVLRLWLTPLLGESNLYHTVWAAVAFSAWYCGLGPSIANGVASLIGVWFLFPDAHTETFTDRARLSGMMGFIFFSGLIIAFGESARRSRARSDQIALSLRESEARLREANQSKQGEIDQRTVELQELIAQSIEQAKLIDLANDAIFVRSATDRIAFWNKGAERLYGWSKDEAMDRPVHDLLHTVFPVPLSEIAQTELWEGELVHTKRDGTPITVASRWTTLRDRNGNFTGWLEVNTDISARKRAEAAARTLSGRILSLQDDERRRIARELHDSLGQYLVSAKVNLDLLSQTPLEPDQRGLLSECLTSVEQSLAETRTISYLLHPPLLDETGFASAARWYVDGFSQRSALKVELDFPDVVRRMDRELETALFRALQEALTNVHRHSRASEAKISLRMSDQSVHLEIADNGRGITPDRLRRLQEDDAAAGVGLAGMRQRMRELGGFLEVTPGYPGTVVSVTIPIHPVEGHSFENHAPDRDVSAA